MPVYFVQAGEGGPIKIGTAANVASRIASIQTCNPVRLSLLGVFVGGVREELRIHRLVAEHRIHSEWYVDCPAVRDAMLALTPAPAFAALPAPRGRPACESFASQGRSPALVRAFAQRGAICRIAEACGLYSSAVSQWRVVPGEHVARVSEITGIPVEDFLAEINARAEAKAAAKAAKRAA